MYKLCTMLACAATASLVIGTLSSSLAQDEPPEWVAQIRPDHPRLFFNSDTWPKVRERALTSQRDYYDLLKEYADKSEPQRGWWGDGYADPDSLPVPPPRPGSDVDPRDWGRQAMSSALVYRIEPSPERLKRIRDMLWASLDYYHACYAANKSVNWYSFSRLSWLAALDWVWNDLDPEDRAEMGRSILAHADEVLHKPDIQRRGSAGHTAAYYGGRNMTLFTGLLLYNEDIDDDAALDMLLEGWGVYEKLLPYRAELVGDDGAALSASVTYAFSDSPEAEWNLIYALRSAAGVDLPAQWRHMAMMPNSVIWNYIPPGLEFGYGSVHHVTNRFTKGRLYLHMSHIMNLYGRTDPQWAGLASTVREMMGGSFAPFARGGMIPYALLMTELDEAPEPVPLEQFNLPMARHFETLGQVIMRSGTGPDDTYALFATGDGLKAVHYDATHFIIYKQGFLALDTGTRRPADNTPHALNYYRQTIAHNCILINMPDEPSMIGTTPVHVGGQFAQRVSKTVAFETGPYYSYVASDATKAYYRDKCDLMVRQFIFLPSDHFVVFDRVVSTQPDYAKTWLMHHGNEPVFNGNSWYSDQDRGRIFCRTLLPENSRLQAVGGPGKEFLVGDYNWEVEPQYLPDGQVPELMGRWRVEVKPDLARTDDVFLHLIQVGDQSLQSMTDAQVNTDVDGAVMLTFDASGRTVTLLFPTSGEIGGHIRITENEKVLVDQPLTQQIAPQEGLAAE
jgi:hypothetical protein